jgi:hypothetical protein
MLFYDIHYAFYWEDILKLENIREDKFNELFNQLKLWVVVFWDDVIHWITSLRNLSITERNYKELNKRGYFSDEVLSNTNKEDIIVEDIDCYQFDQDFQPYTKDVTFDIIQKYELYWDKLQFTYDFKTRELKRGDIFIHRFKEFSERSLFMEAMFDKVWVNEWKSFKDIYYYLDNTYDNSTLESKKSKKIYDLKDKINEIIIKKTQIKDFFVVQKWYMWSEIIRTL